ncbi:MAG: putative ABC transporter ATP-binding protein [Chlamydiae bacterium]|nr:putative ABC transporter ATP-binding protein [Chlamydiota bacterium]
MNEDPNKMKNDEKLFLQALSHVTTPLEFEEPLAVDPLERESLFKVCQIIGGQSNISFVTSHELVLKADNLIEILTVITNASNARFRSVVLDGEWWLDESNHMLAFTKETMQPVALIREKNRYLMIDPQNGEKTPVTETIAKSLSPQAFVFFAVFSKDEDYPWKKALKILFTKSKTQILYFFLFFFISAALGLLLPYVNKVFFDNVIPYLDTGLYFQVFAALLIAAIAASLLTAATSIIKLRLSAFITTRMQAIIWSRVFELSPAFFRSMPTGEVLQRVMLMESFHEELNKNLIRTIISGILSTLYLIPMIYYSWQLSGIVLIVAGLSFLMFIVFIPTLFTYNIKILRLGASTGAALIQMVSGISDIRIFRGEKKAFAFWSRLFTKIQKLSLDLGSLSNYLGVIAQSISMLVIFLIFGGLILIYQNEMGIIAFSLGSFMAFRSAMTTFLGEIASLIEAAMDSQSLFAHWVRIRKVWRGKRKPDYKGLSPEIKGNIEVTHLFFNYEKETKPVIDDLSLTINAGEFTALIGPSGCGKSSLLRLLTGLEVPTSGTIHYDHIPIHDIDPLIFKQQVSAILQTTKVFGGSILENILCGRKAKKEDIEEAIKLSSFDESLKELPLGLATPLPIGGELLSNGQRQRLLLARALLKKPKILFLDEATSSIDNETEQEIINQLLDRGVTLCLVTHQPLLLQKAHVIFVMEKGSIISKGNYHEIFAAHKRS